MSKATREQFEQLVSKAVMDAEFLGKLIADAQQAADSQGIELDNEDVTELKRILTDLQRFSSNRVLAVDDAKSWAIGILHIRTVRTH